MAGIKIIKDSYKALYIKFVWQICLFLLTLNIAASIFQAIETKDGAQSSEPTKTDIISNFSNTHNVSSEEILKLFKRLEDFTHITDHSMTYSEGLVLTLSLFYTIGWGHVTPITSSGKVFAVFISCVGIPITFMMLLSGGRILSQHILDVIKIPQTQNPTKLNKYSENKIHTSSKRMLTPILLIMFLIFTFSFAAMLQYFEGFSFGDALWYSFITMSTIGLGDYTQEHVIRSGHHGKRAGLMIFMFFWILIGMIFLVAIVISILSNENNIKLKSGRQLRGSDENKNKLLAPQDDLAEDDV